MQRGNERFVERLPLVLEWPWLAYVVTSGILVLALALRFAVGSLMPVGYPFVSFFPAVILSSFLFGVRPGIFAAVLGGLASWYFFIPPLDSFHFDGGVLMAMAFYSGVVGIDIALIHFMQRANYNLGLERERNRALAEHHELLFHELQHRVSNNLQVVAALLALHRRHVAEDAARRALDEASDRLALIGRISRALYDPGGPGRRMEEFLTSLAKDLMEASGRSDIALRVEAPMDGQLEPEVAVPLALIVAECVSNAIEHAFAQRGGNILLALEEGQGGAFTLRVTDDGAGLPLAAAPGPDAGSLGLRIANGLAAQIGGRFALEAGEAGGVCARLDVAGRLR
jgi:two-component sensor histidine kinase